MLGFALPQFGKSAYEDVARFAATVEGMGAGSLWVGDRLLAPVRPTVGYAGSDTIPPEFRTSLDPLVALTVAATATRTARLGSNVLVAPWYSPVPLARQLTSIDVISGGRLLPGFGIGWSPDEFRAAGAPFRRRGAHLDELLEVLDAWWTTNPVEYEGERVSIPPSWVDLQPVQRPRPPIYLGGFTTPGLKRVGERADGWLAVVQVPARTHGMAALPRQRAIIDEAARAVGRDPAAIHTFLRVNVAAGSTVEQVAETVRTLNDDGYGDIFVDLMFAVSDLDSHLEWAERLLTG
ncbi:putative F420-dependent oxidoreductase [Nocardia transvalensis]|uniref:Putative F420-dependent oxidoreductase n=1 Tax=Nocardia transvalensis TaxID=37333 RepID=A0A7W9PEM3_9NOCA|nr:TIGR03619 family F420-dependent LLM class oxidoreductase [Nocardia transvalensis]MBB5914278.1 putative F420-dependent oxidoreductase [Nocardia transvalensis]